MGSESQDNGALILFLPRCFNVIVRWPRAPTNVLFIAVDDLNTVGISMAHPGTERRRPAGQ